jgi:hypothetical protein
MPDASLDMVGEHSLSLRRLTVRTAGDMGRDSVGISSEKRGENPLRRKTKDSNARSIRVGLVGP